MTADQENSPPGKRPINLCPWLVTLAGLILYGLTLNHWVTLGSLPIVAQYNGWDWHPGYFSWRPEQFAPLYFVLTLPVRMLPASWQPVALNLFSAVCAAITLGLLVRSVRLLPQDRTKEQRQREGGEFAMLSVRAAFLPPLLAVLALGLQWTFWEHAAAASYEMLDVLVFAILIFCLLKFRVSQNERWLTGFTLVYGLGMANNWALIGFFPLFLIALIWIKRISFFNWRFIGRLAGFGALGLTLYLLLPLVGSLSQNGENFWTLLVEERRQQTFVLLQGIPRWIAVVAGVPAIGALFFAGFRWPSFAGDISAAGNLLSSFAFRIMHVAFLLLSLAMLLDLAYSFSPRVHGAPVPFLSFYYLAALSVGYFSGYLLLVHGEKPLQKWGRVSAISKGVNGLVIGLLWLAALAVPAGLIYRNYPHIRAGNSPALFQYGSELARAVPPRQAVVLSDDRFRLYLLQATYLRMGKADENILIDTAAFPHREYIQYLVENYPQLVSRYPELQKAVADIKILPPMEDAGRLIAFLESFGRQHPLYYLHPSFGYYFEKFYMKPHGMVYELKAYPSGVLLPPAPTADEISAGQNYWDKLWRGPLALLPESLELHSDVRTVASFYSQDLNFWGVQLQKLNQLKDAHERFAEALQLNPQNVIAEINQTFNVRLQQGKTDPVDSADIISKAAIQYRGWASVLAYDGPPDEPELNYAFGKVLAEDGDLRQATALFQRCLQLRPEDLTVKLAMARTYVDLHQPEKSLELIREIRAKSKANAGEVLRIEALAYLNKNDYANAEKLLLAAHQENPANQDRLSILIEFYRVTGYTALRNKQPDESRKRFKNALAYLGEQIRALEAPTSAATPLDLTDVLQRKAEMEMMLGDYPNAIKTLTDVLQQDPANSFALLNRAISELQSGKFDAAKDDYESLEKHLPQTAFAVYYGLAQIADHEKDTAATIKYSRLYLNSAPPETAEFKQIKDRLHQLESH